MIAFCAAPSRAEANDAFHDDVLPLLNRYCVECHSKESAEGGIALDQYQTTQEAIQGGKMWLRVLDAIQSGVMPPKDVPQPAPKSREVVQSWIENDFYAALCRESDRSAPPVVIRRLNRQEYNNTIRDLTGVELDLAVDFPPDDIGFGFDNIGSALNISPIHIEKYLTAAEQAMQAAIELPDVESFPPVELIGLRTYQLTAKEPVKFDHHLLPGRYLADFSLVRVGIAESVPPPPLLIGFGKDRRTVHAAQVQDETVVYRYWLKVAEGDNTVHVSLVPRTNEKENAAQPKTVTANVSGDQRYGGKLGLHVDSMVVRGPVHLPADTLSAAHRAILFCQPEFGDQSRIECANETVSQFAKRAFRRPLEDGEIDGILRIFQLAHDRGESFERAIQITLTTVLVSPRFLFLIEPHATESDRPLTEYELATRLSYFLWSTMPDDELLQDAQQGTLRKNLHAQVERMLADARSQAFVENFTGQWLQLRQLVGVTPDKELFPDFDDELRRAMRRETEAVFAHILRENCSILELLDSDYTFVNEVLARHYKLENVAGEKFQRVLLPDKTRGGVLSHAGILTLTSNHNRTSPVKRGKWILQQLLGTPPPPPPPDVAQLDESPKASSTASLRQRLEVHRSSPECAACHSQMDPMGFALENFDAVGRWRTTDGEFAIDPSGEIMGKGRFNDAQGLRQLLKSAAHRKFSRCLIENMLTYALGRNLELYDFCTVETIRQKLVKDDFRIQNVVLGIVDSKAFQNRGVSE